MDDKTNVTLRDTVRIFKLSKSTLAIALKPAIKIPLDLKVGDYLDLTIRKTGLNIPYLGHGKRTEQPKESEDGTEELDEDSI